MKIYLDTVILNKMGNGKWNTKEEGESFGKILKLYPESFWVSDTLTLQEINNIPDPEFKTKVIGIYSRLNKVSIPAIPSFGSGFLNFGNGFSTQDLYRTKLRKIFTPNKDESNEPKRNYIPHFQDRRGKQITSDADHIYYSFKSGCDYFLTIDKKTIIKRYENNKSDVDKIVSPMKIVDPPTLFNLLNVTS